MSKQTNKNSNTAETTASVSNVESPTAKGNATETTNSKKNNVSNDIREVIGETLLINRVQKQVHRVSKDYIDQVYNNLCNTFGKDNVEVFVVKESNLETLSAILATHKNTIIKK